MFEIFRSETNKSINFRRKNNSENVIIANGGWN